MIQEELEHQVVVRCDAAGRFELAELPPRTVALAAVARGRVAAEWRDIAADAAANQAVVLVLEEGRALAGRVVDSEGRPVERARVDWCATAARWSFELAAHLPGEPLMAITAVAERLTTTSGADGRFRFEGLPPAKGECVVTAFEAAKSSVGQHQGAIYQRQVRYFCEDIRILRQRIAEIDDDLKTQVDGHELATLLKTIEGIGTNTAARLVAELGDPAEWKSAGALASHVGVVPQVHHSGKSAPLRAGIGSLGNRDLRHALWMPVLAAVRCNPWLR